MDDPTFSALAQNAEHETALVVLGYVFLERGASDEAWACAAQVLRRLPDDPQAIGLVVAVKAHQSWFLGLWWRYNTWMMAHGQNAILLLLCMYAAYRLLTLVLEDLGPQALALPLQLAWIGFAAYTWFGPAAFRRQLAQALAPVALRRDF